jgi:hypothetical protein
VGWNYSPPLEGITMTDYERTVKVLEGPWSDKAFPQGEETTKGIISRKITTLYEKDGYLCEEIVTREYRDGDYFDTSTNKRVIKLD